MRRRFYTEAPIGEGKVVLRGQELRHLKNVLRLRRGDEVAVFDGSGREFRGVLESVTSREAVVDIRDVAILDVEPATAVVLIQGLIKSPRMSLVVQKATELGASEIIPVECARSEVRGAGVRSGRAARWTRIAAEAARQCGGVRVPRIHPVRALPEAWGEMTPDDTGYMCVEGGGGAPLGDSLRRGAGAGRVMIAVGPSGGFTGDEVDAARAARVRIVSLGRRVLRSETAAICALAIAMSVLESSTGQGGRGQ